MLSQCLVELPDSSGPLQQPVEVLDKGPITPHHQQPLCTSIQSVGDQEGLCTLQCLYHKTLSSLLLYQARYES